MSGESSHTGVKGLTASSVVHDGSLVRVGIVHARWNMVIINALLDGCKKALSELKVPAQNITVMEVPGSFELPYAASRIVNEYDVVICVGCLIKGETMHFEYICQSVSQGIMELNIRTSTPVIFGVLTCLTEEQAKKRAGLGENAHNHGEDWGKAAVEMALFRAKSEKKEASKRKR